MCGSDRVHTALGAGSEIDRPSRPFLAAMARPSPPLLALLLAACGPRTTAAPPQAPTPLTAAPTHPADPAPAPLTAAPAHPADPAPAQVLTFDGDDPEPEPAARIHGEPKRAPIPAFALFGTRAGDGP